MAFTILGSPKPAFFDSAGAPLVSGTITTTDASDVVKASYPTAADADASTNGTSGDITLDARGEPTTTQYWGKDNETYKVVIKDSAAAVVHTYLAIRMPQHNRRATVTFTGADATPTVAESSTFITAGTTAITDFDDGEVGDTITILSASTITITHGSPVSLLRENDFDMVAGDTLTLSMFNDQVWEEIARTTLGNRAAVTFTGADTTPTIGAGNTFITAGTTAITDFDDGVVGDTIKILGASSIVITHGSPVSLRGEKNFSMVSGDTLTLTMFNDQVWEETARTYAAAFTKFKTADEALTSSTLADDTHLVDWVLQPNTYYRFEGYLKVNADAPARDLEIDITTDNAFVEECYSFITVDAGSALTVDEAETQLLTTAVAVIDIDAGNLVGIFLKGFVLTHATLACNVDFQFANQAGAGTTTVQAGSWASFIPEQY